MKTKQLRILVKLKNANNHWFKPFTYSFDILGNLMIETKDKFFTCIALNEIYNYYGSYYIRDNKVHVVL